MGITLQKEIIEKLSSKGVLAYVAVSLADGTEASTAVLAGLVRCQTAVMLEGIKELVIEAPELIGKVSKKKSWRCGVVKAGSGEVVQILDSETERRKSFIDDLKRYWEWGNRTPFTMDGRDGQAISNFLRTHRDWDRDTWKQKTESG